MLTTYEDLDRIFQIGLQPAHRYQKVYSTLKIQQRTAQFSRHILWLTRTIIIYFNQRDLYSVHKLMKGFLDKGYGYEKMNSDVSEYMIELRQLGAEEKEELVLEAGLFSMVDVL